MISEKRNTPKIAKMNKKSIRRAPTLVIAGRVTKKVWNITFKLFARFSSLKILPILNALISDVYAPTFTEVKMFKDIPIRVPMTIIKSKMFQLSLKNFLSYAISLIIASKVKIAAKK